MSVRPPRLCCGLEPRGTLSPRLDQITPLLLDFVRVISLGAGFGSPQFVAHTEPSAERFWPCGPLGMGRVSHAARGARMQDDLDTADRYVERAEEVRVIAATMTDPRTQKSLLKVADDYLRMAESRKNIHLFGITLRPR